MQTTVMIDCPIDEFDGVTVTYSMMASEKEMVDFYVETGGKKTSAPVVCSVNGWDTEKYGDPFGTKSPMAFRLWAARRGLHQAQREYSNNPDFFTKSSRGTKGTKAE